MRGVWVDTGMRGARGGEPEGEGRGVSCREIWRRPEVKGYSVVRGYAGPKLSRR